MGHKVCVLVTGVGGRSVGHQVLHALLTLGDKYRIVATDAEPFAYGLYQVPHRYVIPAAPDLRYLEVVQDIVKKEKVDVILPGTQHEVYKLGEVGSALSCPVIINPTEIIKLCDRKDDLEEWLKNNGFQIPLTVSQNNWRDLVVKAGFPIVGKPIRNSGGSRNVALLNDDEEVKTYLSESQRNSDDVLFQEYVPSHESEYTVGVLISKSGALIDSIVMHRKLVGLSLHVKRTLKGKTFALSSGYSQGYIVKHPLIQSECERLAFRIGARGAMNIQCRLVDNKKLVIFEVHPRFSGTTSTRADVGFNEPDTLIRNWLFDENFGRLEYRTNVAAIRSLKNIIVPMSDLEGIKKYS
jgi:carbamoyl-phosphate synthase large subunit